MFVTWLRKLFFSAVFSVVTKNGCVEDYNICALGCIKILFFRDVETFILPWIVKNQLKNGLQLYTHQLASKGSRRWRKDGGGWIEVEVIVHASRSSTLAAHVETLNWETVRDEDACTLKRIKGNQCEKEKLQTHLFFPLQIIMSTTGKYSRAVCQSYRESSKSLKFKAYILNKKASLVVSVPFSSRLRRHLRADKQNLAFSRRLDSGARR